MIAALSRCPVECGASAAQQETKCDEGRLANALRRGGVACSVRGLEREEGTDTMNNSINNEVERRGANG